MNLFLKIILFLRNVLHTVFFFVIAFSLVSIIIVYICMQNGLLKEQFPGAYKILHSKSTEIRMHEGEMSGIHDHADGSKDTTIFFKFKNK